MNASILVKMFKNGGAAHRFLFYSLFGLLANCFWYGIGEPWKNLADGSHYITLYENELTQAPFGYRILTPFLARLLPWSSGVNFSVITISCLSLTTGVISLYLRKLKYGLGLIFLTSTFWVTSFPFVYYGTTLIRADAPMFLALSVVLLSSKNKLNLALIVMLIVLGSLAHETMLIIIPILWLDKLFGDELSESGSYSYFQLFSISLVSILLIICTRLLIDVLPGGKSYMGGIFSMVSFVLDYSGGWTKHVLRIYAAFGPIILFAFFFSFPWRFIKRTFSFLSIFFVAVCASFLATDTLRVMAIIIFPVTIYAAKYLDELWKMENRRTVVILVFLQLLYSYVVYGHLRSFESSLMLNGIAAFISVLALAICIANSAKLKSISSNA